MARTPLLRSLIAIVRGIRVSEAQGISREELRERQFISQEAKKSGDEPSSGAFSRRALLMGTLGASGALMLGCPNTEATVIPPPKSKQSPKIVVIGGGIAGLNTALTLADKGVGCTVYEASGRLGGRMFSNKGYFDEDQVFEWYGELIDKPHKTVRGLAERFNVPLDDLVLAQPPGSKETYHFFGKHYPREDAEKDILSLKTVIDEELRLAGEDVTFDNKTPHGQMLDNMSVYDWIEKRVPGGHTSPLGMLLDTAYYIELNIDTREQSALNLLFVLGSQPDWQHFDMFGESDESLKARGGNQRITDAIAAALPPGTLNLGKRMEAIAQRSSGDYELTLTRANTTETIVADYVVLALPFAVLRELDYKKAGFDELKHKTIQELGRGRQSKQHIQFKRRVWNDKGTRPYPGTGTSYSDAGYQVTWEATRAQPGNSGILVGYCGGVFADAMATTVPVATMKVPTVATDAKRFMSQAEIVFPGLTDAWNGKATQGIPHLDPNYKCSYSHWRIGQYQSIRGYERVTQGRVLFAGEHTSTEFQGFMEGGAEEGRRAANEILTAMGRG